MLANYQQQYPELAKSFMQGMNHDFGFDLKAFDADRPSSAEATRNSSGHILNKLQQFNINILGGSADLTASTKAEGINGEFGFSRSGRNINYGVREFSMVAINNGIAAYGMLLPFGGTFFAFLDYCKPALRLAALSQLQNWVIFTHDSVFLGEDGPTHQPIEQLAILRAQPHLLTFRPADFNETLGSYYVASKHSTTPAAFVLSRQNVPQLEHSQVEAVQHGAYTIFATGDNPTFIITATGSEVSLAIQTAELIHQKTHQDVRVISMVCAELFAMQPLSYQKKLYSKHSHTVTLEAATTFG